MLAIAANAAGAPTCRGACASWRSPSRAAAGRTRRGSTNRSSCHCLPSRRWPTTPGHPGRERAEVSAISETTNAMLFVTRRFESSTRISWMMAAGLSAKPMATGHQRREIGRGHESHRPAPVTRTGGAVHDPSRMRRARQVGAERQAETAGRAGQPVGDLLLGRPLVLDAKSQRTVAVTVHAAELARPEHVPVERVRVQVPGVVVERDRPEGADVRRCRRARR